MVVDLGGWTLFAGCGFWLEGEVCLLCVRCEYFSVSLGVHVCTCIAEISVGFAYCLYVVGVVLNYDCGGFSWLCVVLFSCVWVVLECYALL